MIPIYGVYDANGNLLRADYNWQRLGQLHCVDCVEKIGEVSEEEIVPVLRVFNDVARDITASN